MKLLKSIPVFVALVCALPAASAQLCAAAETVYFNGNILTGEGLTAVETAGTHPKHAQALGIASGKILYVGANADILGCAGTKATRIDLHGAFVMPGFNDAHTHMAFAGQQRLTVDLDNVPSLVAMQAKIAAYAATLPAGAWITGGGWDHTKWASKTLPTVHDLDGVSGDHPLLLDRTDGHIAIANTAALKAAGITANTVAPEGSQIDLDPVTHEPTGIIREMAALALVQKVIPKPDAAMRRRALQLAIDDALSHGVTSVQDFSDYEDFKVLQQMEKDGKLPLRFAEWMPFDLPIETLKEYQASQPKDDPYLHTTMLKAFMDGSLGSRTAAMAAPYTDDPKNFGLPKYDQAKLNAMSIERAAAGFQLGFHAIGDKANAMALDAFAAVNQAADELNQCSLVGSMPHRSTMCPAPRIPPAWKSRFRIEHAQVLLPTDFGRFAGMHIIASMQPSHLLTDMAWAGDRLGPERSKYAYAWRSMLDHHITLAFGTDYPVESINPMRGLYAAITRLNVEGTQSFYPEQKLTIEEALYAYTQASAFAEFAEDKKCVLAANHFADFVVLDRDLLTATPQEILKTRVLRTVVGGVTRYEAGSGVAPVAPRSAKPDGD